MKRFLLAGVLSLIGVAPSLVTAQVTSINAVGYVNVTVPAGFSMIANPLNTTANTLAALLPDVPLGTRIYKYSGGAFTIAIFEQDDFGNNGWDRPTLALAPGEGAFIFNPGAQYTKTFVGEVLTGNVVNAIPAGFSIRSSAIPQTGQLDTTLAFPVAVNDRVYRLVNGSYVIYTYELDDFGNPNWSSAPVPNVGESFWVLTTVAKDWTRSFSIN